MMWAFDHLLAAGAIVVLVGLAFGGQRLGGIPRIGPFLATFFKPLRKDLLWAAFCIALLLGGQFIESARCVAKTVVIEKVIRGNQNLPGG